MFHFISLGEYFTLSLDKGSNGVLTSQYLDNAVLTRLGNATILKIFVKEFFKTIVKISE